MKIAITGGTGFVGRHLARELVSRGHEVVLIARGVDKRDEDIRNLPGVSFAPVGTGGVEKLTQAFAGCDGVAHLAGINREIGEQTYRRVHVQGMRNVVEAAKRAGVKKVLLLSFLRARPRCGSPYHESKWAAEQIVRRSGLDYTILKASLIYGKGDQMVSHLSRVLHTMPLFASTGMKEKEAAPVAVGDVVDIMCASLVEGRLSRQTVAVVGPEKVKISEVVRRIAKARGRWVLIFPMPVWFHYALAWMLERVMVIPLVSFAQVRILSEGVEPVPPYDPLPEDLRPKTRLTQAQIRKGLPEPGGFGLKDLRWFAD
jgi:uncharacterized protein YbjT (DUF2867 family)